MTFGDPGTCVIDANQAGNTAYQAAMQVQQVMTLYGPECRPVTRQGLRFPRGWDNSCAIGVPSGVTQPLTASYPTPAA